MIIVSHRGNLSGPSAETENKPHQIDLALKSGFHVEVDLRIIDNNFWLGHDNPDYLISKDWLLNRNKKLIIHSKDLITSNFLAKLKTELNWFYHTDEDVVLTSWGFLWCYPKIYLSNGITVLLDDETKLESEVLGVCTDYPEKFKLDNQ